ncbi:hypothetical protein OCAR_7561 [Afipia carboxidovorans OM5]|nr:hypothetical protein OCAR_7561 [Afipia carboxidovorans OM5]
MERTVASHSESDGLRKGGTGVLGMNCGSLAVILRPEG